ncbi:MAG: SGNH/GDSL hydrolase family protein [bacterium]
MTYCENDTESILLTGIHPVPSSTLMGKKLLFLGSSVTYGCEPEGISFVEFLCRHSGCIGVKAAVSGTTLADISDQSYVSRLKKVDRQVRPDAIIVQLSTNDAGLNHRFGVIAGRRDLGDYDVMTIAGAIEYIIAYARQTWRCPVLFYTGTRYDNETYGRMVTLLLAVQKAWGIGVIDLWHDPLMNQVAAADYARFMADGVHPTIAGYFQWWGPRLETLLGEFFEKKEQDPLMDSL